MRNPSEERTARKNECLAADYFSFLREFTHGRAIGPRVELLGNKILTLTFRRLSEASSAEWHVIVDSWRGIHKTWEE
jgi:hypothetical protein